jgi:hypothetical protein
MTLKEKLFNTVFDNAWEYKHEDTVPKLEKIADDYAISFAEWFINSWCLHSLSYGDITIKQSLEIFKKENGY